MSTAIIKISCGNFAIKNCPYKSHPAGEDDSKIGWD